METIDVSVGEWMDGCIKNTHTQNGMLLNHKKEWNLAICDNMDGSWAHYAKWNKSDREIQTLYDLKHANKQTNKNKLSDT